MVKTILQDSEEAKGIGEGNILAMALLGDQAEVGSCAWLEKTAVNGTLAQTQESAKETDEENRKNRMQRCSGESVQDVLVIFLLSSVCIWTRSSASVLSAKCQKCYGDQDIQTLTWEWLTGNWGQLYE